MNTHIYKNSHTYIHEKWLNDRYITTNRNQQALSQQYRQGKRSTNISQNQTSKSKKLKTALTGCFEQLSSKIHECVVIEFVTGPA